MVLQCPDQAFLPYNYYKYIEQGKGYIYLAVSVIASKSSDVLHKLGVGGRRCLVLLVCQLRHNGMLVLAVLLLYGAALPGLQHAPGITFVTGASLVAAR